MFYIILDNLHGMKNFFEVFLIIVGLVGNLSAQNKDSFENKTGIGVDIGILAGPGFSYKKLMDSGYGFKVILTPPLFSKGKIAFYNFGMALSKQVYSMRDCRFFLTGGVALAYIDKKTVFSAPSISIDGEYKVADNQSFMIGFGWSLYSFSPSPNEMVYQSFPGFQFGYTYYIK